MIEEILSLLKKFNNKIYLEIQRHNGQTKRTLKIFLNLSSKLGLPLIATQEVFYLM